MEKTCDYSKCEKCKKFYDCDNSGLYEECLPTFEYFEEDTTKE